MNSFRAEANNDHAVSSSVAYRGVPVITRTLVQSVPSLYNKSCISNCKECAYLLTHCASRARSPPKTKKTQRGRSR